MGLSLFLSFSLSFLEQSPNSKISVRKNTVKFTGPNEVRSRFLEFCFVFSGLA